MKHRFLPFFLLFLAVLAAVFIPRAGAVVYRFDGDDILEASFMTPTNTAVLSAGLNTTGTKTFTAATDSVDTLASYIELTVGSDLTLTSTPQIADGPASGSRTIILHSSSGNAGTLTFQDEDDLAGSGVRRGGSSLSLAPGETMTFSWDPEDGYWLLTSHPNTQATLSASGVTYRNASGSPIAAGTPVYSTGYNVGQDLNEIALAGRTAVHAAIGLTAESIGNNANGLVIRQGPLAGIDTSSYSVGDVLYLGDADGTLTTTKPATLQQPLAVVTRSHASNGSIDIYGNFRFSAPGSDALDTVASTITGAGFALLDDADVAAQRSTLNVYSTGETDSAISTAVSAVTAASLGLVIGNNVQAWDADLDALAAANNSSTLASIDQDVGSTGNPVFTSMQADTLSGITLSLTGSPADDDNAVLPRLEADARYTQQANNGSDFADIPTTRTNLGLGSGDSPTFAGLSITTSGTVDLNGNRLTEVGDATADMDALNRQTADNLYYRQSAIDEAFARRSASALAGVWTDGTDEAISIANNAALHPRTYDFSLILPTITLDDWTPASRALLAVSSDTDDPTTAADGWMVAIETNGKLSLYVPAEGTTAVATTTDPISPTLAIDYAGLDIAVTVNRSGQEVNFYVGGQLLETVDVSATLATTTDIGASSPIRILATTAGWANGYFLYCNEVTSASRIAAALINPDIWRRVGASAVIYASDFSAGTDSFTVTNGTGAGNIDGILGENDCYRFTVDATSNAHSFVRVATLLANTYQRLTARAYAPAANDLLDGTRMRSSPTGSGAIAGTNKDVSGAWTDIAAEGDPLTNTTLHYDTFAAGNVIYQDAGADDVIYVKDILVVTLGQLLMVDLTEAGTTKSDLIGSFDGTRGATAEDAL